VAEPWDPVVSAGLWTYFVATLDKAQYNYCMHAAQILFFSYSVAGQGTEHWAGGRKQEPETVGRRGG